MKEDRVILHCDANSFFASVECVFHPEYKDVPMAVCGSEAERHGIVLAKNIPAARYGIRTAETVYSARKKCPHLLTVPPRYHEYTEYSRALNEIYSRYTDLVEPFGIDESWLDVTGSRKLFGSGKEIAEQIRETVKRELSLTVSVGVSFNKVFAKLGSDYKKPDAVTEITRENMETIVYPLPVSDLLFVGRKTADALEKIGIRRIGDLAAASPLFLENKFGKHGAQIAKYARGEDDSPVIPASERQNAKSIGSGMTFPRDLLGIEDVRTGLAPLAEDVAGQLRHTGKKCRTVCLTIRDVFLRTITRQKTVEPPTDLARTLLSAAMEIYHAEWQSDRPIRMLTVTAQNLVAASETHEQISIFEEENEQREKQGELERTIDRIRQRFGQDALRYGSTLGGDLSAPKTRKRQSKEQLTKSEE